MRVRLIEYSILFTVYTALYYIGDDHYDYDYDYGANILIAIF